MFPERYVRSGDLREWSLSCVMRLLGFFLFLISFLLHIWEDDGQTSDNPRWAARSDYPERTPTKREDSRYLHPSNAALVR